MASWSPLPLVPFVGSVVLTVLILKQERNASKPTCIPAAMISMTKETVLSLRGKYFSKAVSISYANSGPLMIVAVGLFLACIGILEIPV
jgi:hypothetical protein